MEGCQKKRVQGQSQGQGQSQIHVPPELPEILKQFTKTAIKVQPPDVLAWSAAYFRALANGEAKENRWQSKDTSLTPSLLRVLNKQLGPLKMVPLSQINEKWLGLAMCQEHFDSIVQTGRFSGDTDWTDFFSVACHSLAQNLNDAMTLACEVLTTESDCRIPYSLFVSIYRYLATGYYNVSTGHVDYVVGYLDDNFAKKQNGFILPNNFLETSPSYPGLCG